jgi:hypothetical protein
VRKHTAATGIQTECVDWGKPTLVIRDLDSNEIFLLGLAGQAGAYARLQRSSGAFEIRSRPRSLPSGSLGGGYRTPPPNGCTHSVVVEPADLSDVR